jgi:hypothetical protein
VVVWVVVLVTVETLVVVLVDVTVVLAPDS